MVERPPRRGESDVRRLLAVRGNVTLPDSGALHDPLVGGVDDLREVVVRHDPAWKIGADADDSGTTERHIAAAPEVVPEAVPGRSKAADVLKRCSSSCTYSWHPLRTRSNPTPIAFDKPWRPVRPG